MQLFYANPQADLWYQDLKSDPGKIPFSFRYNGTVFRGFPAETFSLLHTQIHCENRKETQTRVFSFRDGLTVSQGDRLAFRLPFGNGPFRFRDEDTGESFTSQGDGILEFPAPRTAKLIWVEHL